MLVEAVTVRLGSAVAALEDSIAGALSLAELLARKALPQRPVSAFVIPAGLTGREALSSEAAFVQAVDETVAVVLVVRAANDSTGGRALPELEALVWSVIGALCGWSPEPEDNLDPVGVLELRRGRTLQLSAGTVVYQLDFALLEQVRITG